MASPSHKPRQSIESPGQIKRKTSIISNLQSKIDKQPNLRKLSIFTKVHDSNPQIKSAALKTDHLNTAQSSSHSARKSSVFQKANPNLNSNENRRKSIYFDKEKDLKNLLIDDPDITLLDLSRFVKKRLYKKSYYLCEKYLTSKRNFRLFYEIRFNRMFLTVINKICKVKFIKNQPSHPKFLHKILIKALFGLKNYCNYLTIFFNKKYARIPKKIAVEDRDCEAYISFSEDLLTMPKKFEKIFSLRKNSSNFFSTSFKKSQTSTSFENIHEKLDFKGLFDGEYREDDEYFTEVIQREKYKLKKISIDVETFFFLKNIFELLMNFSIVYRNMGSYELAYKYLKCVDEHGKWFEYTMNPDLLKTLIKGKVLLGSFFLQFYKYDEAIKSFDQALLLGQKEFIIRMNMIFYMKEVKRKFRMNFLSCVRNLIIILFSMSLAFAYQRKFRKMLESLSLAQMFADKFLQRIDVVKKFINKIYSDLGENVAIYFHELAEMEKIILDLLKTNKTFQNKYQKAQNQVADKPDPLQEYNEKLYYKYGWDIFNKTHMIFFPIPRDLEKKPTLFRKESKKNSSFRLHKKSSSLPEENLLTQTKTENKDSGVLMTEILSGRSFMKDEGDSNLDILSQSSSFNNGENPFIYLNSISSRKLFENNSKLLTKMNYEELPLEYKPRVLTTNKYFKKFKTSTEENAYLLERNNNIVSPQIYSEENDKEKDKNVNKDLDYFMKKAVESNINTKYSSKSYDQKLEDFKEFMKDEDFDKKEFTYCKKMLFIKRKENCSIKNQNHKKKINSNNAITLNNTVEKEANVIEGKISVQKETDIIKENIKKKYKTILLEQEAEEKESQTSKNGDFKTSKLVKLILKYKNELNLNKVAKNYQDKMKEKEKLEKKNLEENLKKQSQMNKKRDFYNFKSIHTLKHLLDNKKISQSSYFKVKSHRLPKKPWASSIKSNFSSGMRSGLLKGKDNLGSTSRKKSTHSEVTIDNLELKNQENFEKAQNIIKVLSGEIEKIKENENKLLGKQKIKNQNKNSENEEVNTFNKKALNDLAKSSFYLSLERHNKKKIMTFTDLVKIKAKQHFKGSINFFGKNLFGSGLK